MAGDLNAAAMPGVMMPGPMMSPTASEPSAGAAIELIKKIFWRRWKYVVFTIVLSGAAAFALSELVASDSWTYMGTLFYHRSPSAGPYTPTDVHTWSALVKSPEL